MEQRCEVGVPRDEDGRVTVRVVIAIATHQIHKLVVSSVLLAFAHMDDSHLGTEGTIKWGTVTGGRSHANGGY